MAQKRLDLANLFQAVTQALAENQPALDQADEYNRNHGNNMVQTFQTITSALQKKKGSSDSVALRYAAKQLSQKTASGSGKLYAQNLTQAATQFKGKQVDTRGALSLLQTLIGGGQAGQSSGQPAGGDLLGALLGGLAGGGDSSAQPSSQAGGDILGNLLGGLAGGETTAPQSTQTGGGDLLGMLLGGMTGSGGGSTPQSGSGDLLGALLGGLTGGSGGSTLGTLAQAFLGGSGMGKASHREQSTQLVINAFLQALSALSSK